MTRATVLGANGFLGAQLCRKLAQNGMSVVAYDRYRRSNQVARHPEITVARGDIADRASLAAAIRGSQVVFQFASSTTPASSALDPVSEFEDSLRPSLTALEISAAVGVERFFFASSGGTIYGNARGLPTPETAECIPISPYGIAKLTIESMMRHYSATYSMDCVALRIANPYGPTQTVKRAQGIVPMALQCAMTGAPFVVQGDGSMVRDYIHSDDLLNMVVRIADPAAAPHHRTYNLGRGVGTSINQLVEIVESIVKRPIRRQRVEPPNSFVHSSILDTCRFDVEFGPVPRRDVEHGIRDIVYEAKGR